VRNKDKRIERYHSDPEFNQVIELILSLLYSGINFTTIKDAIYVATLKYEMENPTIRSWMYNSNATNEMNEILMREGYETK
jgi:hypothetical protein